MWLFNVTSVTGMHFHDMANTFENEDHGEKSYISAGYEDKPQTFHNLQ